MDGIGARTRFAGEMEELGKELLSLGIKVEEQLRKAASAVRNGDLDLAREVKAGDGEIDALQLAIEDRAGRIIATQQPVASDLRELVTVFKVADNLERAGDHARHLAKAAKKFSGEAPSPQIERLGRMAERGCEMVRGAVDAFLERDVAKARAVAAMDDAIDAEHRALIEEALGLMRQAPERAERASKLIATSGFLERLGDHMTNVCEAVVFMVEGRHVELNE